MMLLLRKGKPVPDSLLTYFAAFDDYRFEQYTDLKKIGKKERFPEKFNNHIDLGRSSLLDKKTYDKPDTLVYITKLKAAYKGKTGLIYFFKYKEKKDDLNWKLATVGLVPENPAEFEFEDTIGIAVTVHSYRIFNFSKFNRNNFTQFTDTKLKENEALDLQLGKELKKVLYAGRKSARNFYERNSNEYDGDPDYID